jgi:hypothetical protein
MDKRLEQLKERAIAANAIGNYNDAIYDLYWWPNMRKQILDDLEECIRAHEEDAGKPWDDRDHV